MAPPRRSGHAAPGVAVRFRRREWTEDPEPGRSREGTVTDAVLHLPRCGGRADPPRHAADGPEGRRQLRADELRAAADVVGAGVAVRHEHHLPDLPESRRLRTTALRARTALAAG